MNLLVFVGSCTAPVPYFGSSNGEGISAYRFNLKTAEFEKIGSFSQIENPTFLSVNSSASRIYANSELLNWPQGLVTTLSFDKATGRFAHLDMVPSRGSITAYNSLTSDEKFLLAANYGEGNQGPDQSLVVFPVSENGGLGMPVCTIKNQGSGPNPDRQERSHTHFAHQLPTGNVVAADLGLDQVIEYTLSEEGHLNEHRIIALPAGSGPRHIAWTSDGAALFVVNELLSTVAHIDMAREGTNAVVDICQTVPDSLVGESFCSDIQIAPDGRFLYVGNRGDDTISVIQVADDGALSLHARVPAGGKTPRNLALTPCGTFLFSANQDSDRVSIFRRDARSGDLEVTGMSIETGTPMVVALAQA